MPIDTTNADNSGHKIACPECQASGVSTAYQEDTFTYGDGEEAVNLTCRIPVRNCRSCGMQFTDDEAEDIRHETVCKHLRVMPPREVVDIRKRYKFSRGDFARITRIGEASLARWENGHVIQNAANDQLLYLLTFSENVDRLRQKDEKETFLGLQTPAFRASEAQLIKKTFRALAATESHHAAARSFELRPVTL